MSRASDEKCVWCNGSEGDLEAIEIPAPNQFPFEGRDPRPEEVFVHPAHESLTRDFAESAHREGGRFVLVMLFLPFLLGGPGVLAVLLSDGAGAKQFWAGVLIGPSIMLLGLFLLRHPYATPQTVDFIGIKQSVRVVRITAGCTVAAGMWMLGWGLL